MLSTPNSPRVAVVGAGIGGLCAAALLRKHGLDVQVFEQADNFGEVGAGIQLSPNGVKVLHQLGLENTLNKMGVRPQHMVLKAWKTGITISKTSIAGDFDRAYGAPYFHIHRADLHECLLQLLPEATVRLRSRITGLHQLEEKVQLNLPASTEEFDIVVGADGIHSIVRETLHGAQKPRFTGNVAFRALVPVDDEIKTKIAKDSTIWVGPKGHVVLYYVRGGSLLNIVAVYESEQWTEESWTQKSKAEDLIKAFSGWNSDLLKILSRVKECNRWALYDRDPLPHWSKGRVTLLGDAAHPMLPFLAQGGAMAIEDAYALSEEISLGDNSVDALKNYEHRRIKRTSHVQLAARSMGKKMHVSSNWESLRRNLKLYMHSRFQRDEQLERGKSLYGYDVTKAGIST